jgi:acetoin utilization deacetylase AcuC-like enzyme
MISLICQSSHCLFHNIVVLSLLTLQYCLRTLAMLHLLQHMPYVTSEEHQECPARLQRLAGPAGALRSSEFSALEWGNGSGVSPATISDILRVHEHDYIQHLQVSA